MEATGVYSKPVWSIRSESEFALLVINAAHIKNVPGRKTDVNDARWNADLAACGLLRASFVPAESQPELRSLMRTRKQLARELSRHVRCIQKTLRGGQHQAGHPDLHIMGLNSRQMIEAMIAGVRDPGWLAALAGRRRQATPEEL